MGNSDERRRNAPARRTWAKVDGYSRAGRIGHQVEIAGAGRADEHGELVAPGDAYAQAAYCLQVIGDALGEVGASFEDVIRTRVYLRDMGDWEAVGRAHGEVFADIQPA